MNRAPSRPVGFKYLYIPCGGQPHSPRGYEWNEKGVIYAECVEAGQHDCESMPSCESIPNEGYCQCGIHAAFDLSLCNQHDDWSRALFLIEGFGRCLISQNGFRAELARIVAVVRTPWCIVDYNEIAVFPIPPRISLEAAVAVISEHRAQWLALDPESKSSANVAPMVNSRRAIKAIPQTSRLLISTK